MNKQYQKKKITPGKVIAIILALTAMEPEVLIFVLAIVPIAVIGYLVYFFVKKSQGAPSRKQISHTSGDKFDDCPQPLFCFHRDKGEHHVRKGKEMDPWDRPDIDISKYQRNR